jgi:Ni/Co efflux regulator RcnB
MKSIRNFIALLTIATTLTSGAAIAEAQPQDARDRGRQEHHDHPYVRHDEWRKGYHMKREDWGRAERIDYRTYHLRRPPRGYEWREVDGNYVLAAVATGVIASLVVASTVR